ncbi:hypothetical protein GLYMA_09G065950v4 [Glycine max]|nr:hypothetical protein GLYMA_09G065950v4 [Glycine max]KAH1041803.1 hypothetical protein GYH30_024246 [Glycine max]
MSKDTFKLVYLFVILAIQTCHGLSSSREPNTKAGEVNYARCVRDGDCNPYPPYLD